MPASGGPAGAGAGAAARRARLIHRRWDIRITSFETPAALAPQDEASSLIPSTTTLILRSAPGEGRGASRRTQSADATSNRERTGARAEATPAPRGCSLLPGLGH